MRASMRCLVVLAATLVGCSQEITPGQSTDRVGRVIQPVIGGLPSGAEHDAVVVLAQFEEGARRGLCSATLVAPNLLLTARHCVSNADTSVACNPDGSAAIGAVIHADVPASNLVVFTSKNGVVTSLTDESLAAARGTALLVDESTSLCNHDIAFVLLDRPVDAPIATLRLSGGPSFAERVSIVGFGIDETGGLPASRQERADVAVIGSGPMLMPDDKRYGIGNSEVMFGESACLGDSGGPAFTRSGALVGVASRVGNGMVRDPANLSSTCTGDTAHAIYTHLGGSAGLVKRAFDRAGNYPVVEPAPLANTLPKAGDPLESEIGADLQDPSPEPSDTKSLRASALLEDAEAPGAADDGGCAIARAGDRRAPANVWLALVGLVVVRSLRKRGRRWALRGYFQRLRNP